MAQPNEADVATFLDCTFTINREAATTFIRHNNNNVQAAINAYYDDPNPARYQTRYDESQWHEDRQGGGTQMESFAPFQKTESDGSNPDLMALTGPSRPPSRISYPQNWSSYTSQEPGFKGSTSYQEMGIVASESKEYVPDAEPTERIRQKGQPAFLKPLPRGDFLPSLVTILQTIPACRDMLLDVAHLDDYGYNGRWWEGEAIQAPNKSLLVADARVNDELLYEVQRLMAFLESTDRSYGSAEALAQLTVRSKPLDDWATEPLFARFMSCLENAVQTTDEQHANSMFRIKRIASDTGQHTTNDSCFVEIDESDFGLSTEPDLYEVLDHHVWGRSWPIAEPQYWLDDNVAAICVFNLPKPSPKAVKRHLRIPATLCADRYLHSRADHVKSMREQTRDSAIRIDQIQANLRTIQTYSPTGGVELNASQLIDESIKFLENRQNGNRRRSTFSKPNVRRGSTNSASRFTVADGQTFPLDPDHSDAIMSDTGDFPGPPHVFERNRKVIDQLKEISVMLETRASDLYAEQTEARNNMNQLSRLFTDPSVEGPLAASIKYSLRGVATKPSAYYNVTYAMFPKSSHEDSDNGEESLEWWKITYDGETSSASVEKERIKEEDVILAVRENNCEALLVYAREELCEVEESDIPEPLQRFVEKDNMSFANELTRRGSLTHTEFVTFDEDIASDTPQLPPPSYVPKPSSTHLPPRPREMEEVRRDADVIMGVSPSLAPTKNVDFDDGDSRMGGL